MIKHEGKWFENISPGQLASDVARWTLGARMDAVVHYFPLAATAHEEDVEYVHQLRVACRRATAAVAAWAEFLPAKRARRTKRLLKKIRKSANDARDDDVLLERLLAEQDPPHDDLGPLIEQITDHRLDAQRPIVAVFDKIGEKRFARRATKLVDSVEWWADASEPTFAQFARERMAVIVAEFFDVATDGGTTAQGLHALRISGKRLRYEMEIFTEAFPRAFREQLYPCVEELQDKLGALNDHSIAQLRFQRIVATMPPATAAAHLAGLIQQEWMAFQQDREAFLAWWTPEQMRKLQSGLEQSIHSQSLSDY